MDTTIYVFNHWAQFHLIKEPIQVHARLVKDGTVIWRTARLIAPDGCITFDSHTIDTPPAVFQMEAWHPGFATAPATFRLQVYHHDPTSSSDHHSTELRVEADVFYEQFSLGPEDDAVLAQRGVPGGRITLDLMGPSGQQAVIAPTTSPVFISVRDTFGHKPQRGAVRARLEGGFGISEWYVINGGRVSGNHLLTHRGPRSHDAIIPVPLLPAAWAIKTAVSVTTHDEAPVKAILRMNDEDVSDTVEIDPFVPWSMPSPPAGALALLTMTDVPVAGVTLTFSHEAWGASDFVENNSGNAPNNVGYYVSGQRNRKVVDRSIKARTNTMGAFRLSHHEDTGLAIMHYAPTSDGREHRALIELFRPDGAKLSANVMIAGQDLKALWLSDLFPMAREWNPEGYGWMRVSCYTANLVSYTIYLDYAHRTLSCLHLWGG